MFRTVLPLMLLAACGGGNYCSRASQAAEDCGDTVSDEDMATCEEALAKCSKEDEGLLNDSYDCLEDGGYLECATASPTTTMTMSEAMEELAAMMACYEPLAGLSEECAAGFGATMTTPTTTGGTM